MYSPVLEGLLLTIGASLLTIEDYKQESSNCKQNRAPPMGNETIYLHRSGPLLENGLDRLKNRYGRYGFPGFYSISISTVGVDEARVFL